jgi:hypothetical protein
MFVGHRSHSLLLPTRQSQEPAESRAVGVQERGQAAVRKKPLFQNECFGADCPIGSFLLKSRFLFGAFL